MQADYFAHPSAFIDVPCEIGQGTKIRHFCHVMPHARIGKHCTLEQNVVVSSYVEVGNNVMIQNNVALYTGAIIEDDVYLGPSCVLTNLVNPRSEIVRKHHYERIRVCKGATIGANATILSGATIGCFAFVAAGAVVTRDVPDYGLMIGVPARRVGWMSRHGFRLTQMDADGILMCPYSGLRYREITPGQLRCIDLDECLPLPVAA